MSKPDYDFINNGEKMGMTTNKAIGFIQEEMLEGSLDPRIRSKLEDIITLLKSNQALVTKFSEEGDEYQKKLDEIDLSAMQIQTLLCRIRSKI